MSEKMTGAPTVHAYCTSMLTEIDKARAEHQVRCHCYHDCASCAELRGAADVLQRIKTKLEAGELIGIAFDAREES